MNKWCIFTVIACLFALISSCEEPTRETRRMDEAWRLMENAPDSSLMILDSINTLNLRKDKEKARYALLKSMALDKNVIDTTTFDVLQPAIDYYPKHGTPDEKLRTYYYQGRIHQNAGRNDEAMRAFVNGLYLRNEITDSLTLARILIAQSPILKSTFDFEGATNNYLKAAKIFLKSGRFMDYGDCLLMAENNSILQYDLCESDKWMLKIDSIMNLCSEAFDKGWITREEFYPSKLTYLEEKESTVELEEFLPRINELTNITPDGILTLGRIYLTLDQPKATINLLHAIELADLTHLELKKYNAVMAQANKRVGLYKESVDNYESLMEVMSREDEILLGQRLHGSAERNELNLDKNQEMQKKHSSELLNLILIILLVAVLAIGVLTIIIIRTRKNVAEEKEKSSRLEIEKLNAEKSLLEAEHEKTKVEMEYLRLKIANLENEKEELTHSLHASELSPKVKEVLRTRIEKLNSILAAAITSNEKHLKTYKEWERELIADTKNFMTTTRLAFTASHPEFIQYLVDKKLTEDEINYVCLYAVGMNGKDVGIYMKRPSHVNMSSAIRAKFEIDKNETNIGIYVRRLLKNLGKKDQK